MLKIEQFRSIFKLVLLILQLFYFQIETIYTTNIFDYEMVELFDEEEFNVYSCYDSEPYQYSWLDIIFPTTGNIISDNYSTE